MSQLTSILVAFTVLLAVLLVLIIILLSQIRQLRAEALFDHLTGLYTRRAFDRRLEEMLTEARRHRIPIGLLFLDLDHFKRINDGHGHQAGDQALCLVAEVIRDSTRRNDVAMRLGDEFIIACRVDVSRPDPLMKPHSPAQSLLVLSERIRSQIEARSRNTIHLTVSVGGAIFRPEESQTELCHRADQAMYQAKQAGGNQVVIKHD